MVVKSLWADIQEYGAESGLIVTISSLSPGAEKVCTARNYPIPQANRETLKQWVNVMRTPYKGVSWQNNLHIFLKKLSDFAED